MAARPAMTLVSDFNRRFLTSREPRALLRTTAPSLEIQCQSPIGGKHVKRGLLAIDRAAWPALKRAPARVAGKLGAECRHRLCATWAGGMRDV
jgi:hypothetical protein